MSLVPCLTLKLGTWKPWSFVAVNTKFSLLFSHLLEFQNSILIYRPLLRQNSPWFHIMAAETSVVWMYFFHFIYAAHSIVFSWGNYGCLPCFPDKIFLAIVPTDVQTWRFGLKRALLESNDRWQSSDDRMRFWKIVKSFSHVIMPPQFFCNVSHLRTKRLWFVPMCTKVSNKAE